MADDPNSISFDVEASLSGLVVDLRRAKEVAHAGGVQMAQAQAAGYKQAQTLGSLIDEGIAEQKAAFRRLAEDIQTRAYEGGVAASEQLSKGVESGSELSKAGQRLGSKLVKGLIVGVAIHEVDQALRGIADALSEGKTWEEAGMKAMENFTKGLQSLPIAGALGTIFSEVQERYNPVYRAIFGTPLADQRDKARAEAERASRAAAVGAFTGNIRDMTDSASDDDSTIEGRRAIFMRRIAQQMNEAINAGMSASEAQAKAEAAFEAVDAKRRRADAEAEAKRQRDDDLRNANLVMEAHEALERQRKEEEKIRKDAHRKQLDEARELAQEQARELGKEIDSIRRVSASDFITTANTAAGTFTVAQADAGAILRRNTEQLVNLTKRQNDLLEEIKRIEESKEALA